MKQINLGIAAARLGYSSSIKRLIRLSQTAGGEGNKEKNKQTWFFYRYIKTW